MHRLIPGTAQDAGFRPDRLELIRQRCRDWMAQGTPAIAVLLARRGVIAMHDAYGVRTPDGEALTADSVFPVGSVTKPITATAVMLLVEDGLVSLNRQLREYIPEICGAGTDEIEVHHLLTHTSGYDPNVMMERRARANSQALDDPPDANQSPAMHRRLKTIYDVPAVVPPGTRNEYCLENYDLLGEIVRRVSGESLEAFVRRRIFDPLEMADTSYTWLDRFQDRVVKRGPAFPFGGRATDFINMDDDRFIRTPWPNGGINSTARDLATFCQTFLDSGRAADFRLLSRASISEMTTNQIPGVPAYFQGNAVADGSWGYGWMIQSYRRWRNSTGSLAPRSTFYHGGIGGSTVWVDPVNEIVGVYLSIWRDFNIDQGPVWDFDLFQNMVTAAVE